MTTSVEALMQRLNERTTERDYHMGISDILAARIAALEMALQGYKKQFCEGWCSDDPSQYFEDCSGCHARAALDKDTELAKPRRGDQCQ